MATQGVLGKRAFLLVIICLISLPAFAQRSITNGAACVTGSSNFWDQGYVCDGSAIWRHPAYQFGTSGASCAPGLAGTVQWTGSDIQVCDGGSWTSLINGMALGTSVTAANPQISGDATSGFYTPGAATVAVTAGGKEVIKWNTLSGGIDYIGVTPGLSGTPPAIAVAGTTANQGINLTAKGTGAVNITAANTGLQLGGTAAIRFPTADTTAGASIAIGSSALRHETSSAAYYNIAIGYGATAGTMTTSSTGNIAIGNTTGGTGSNSVILGSGANQGTPANVVSLGFLAEGASNDVCVGSQTLWNNTGGGNNVAVGNQTRDLGSGSDTSPNDTAFGSGTFAGLTTGGNNTGLGYYTGLGVATGSNNVFLGDTILQGGDDAQNTIAGSFALSVGSGNDNAVIGAGTLFRNTGNNNTVVGEGALGAATGISNGAAAGYLAGSTITTGSNNTILGEHVGDATLQTGANNILIGSDGTTDTPTSSTSNWMNIGNAIYGYNLYNTTNSTGVPQIAIGLNLTSVTAGAALDLSSNTNSMMLPIGTTGQRPGTGVNGMIRYSSTVGALEVYQAGAWVNYTATSDARLKTDVTPMQDALGMAEAMRPVTYKWDMKNPRNAGREGDKEHIGFIAQELEKILPDVVDIAPDTYRTVHYDKIVTVAIAAIREQQAILKKQDAEAETQQKQLTALREQLAALQK